VKHTFLLVFLFVFGGGFTSRAATNRVEVLLRLEPGTKHFWCRYTLTTAPDAAREQLLLNLNKTFQLISVKSVGALHQQVKPYLYPVSQDTVQGINLRYAPGQQPRQITLTYQGTLAPAFATAQVMELSGHTDWLPTLPFKEYELVDYVLDVQAPAQYSIISTSPPTRHRKGHYRFRGRTSAIELTALAAEQIHRISSATNPTLSVYKAGMPLNHADTLLLAETQRVVSFYNRSIGQQDAISRFSILLPGTDRDAFGLLDNATVITYPDFDVRKGSDRLVLAHEISHKWWAYGSFHDYNDWLNEAFATYSSLLYLRAAGDTAAFRQELAKRVKSATGAPAIIGFTRTTQPYATYRRVIYDKGTVVLSALHTRIGDAQFFQILATTAAQKTATTDEFLTIVEQAAGPDTRSWLTALLTT
jgi:hypothetical protein